MRTFVEKQGKIKRVNNRFGGEECESSNPFVEADRRKTRRRLKTELSSLLTEMGEDDEEPDTDLEEQDDALNPLYLCDSDDIHLKYSSKDRMLLAACCF